MGYPLTVDWDYIRAQLRRSRGDKSYRDLADRFDNLSASTLQRFLVSGKELDLTSLLCVVNTLNLDLNRIFVAKPVQGFLLDRH